MKGRVDSFARLSALPAILSIADLQIEAGIDERSVVVYLNRWRSKGMVQRFGDGIYFNLVADPESPKRIAEAFDKMLRRPVLRVGPGVLHAAGWTSQIHRTQDFVSPVLRDRRTLPATEGDVSLSPRYMPWFETLRASAQGDPQGGILSVSPSMALADALLSASEPVARKRPVHAVPPDELDLDGFTQERFDEVETAMTALGATRERIEELLGPYEAAIQDAGNTVQW